AYRRQPYRADQQGADARRVGEVEPMRQLLADAIGGARIAARPERALVQALDRRRVLRLFGQDGEGKVGHQVSRELAFGRREVHGWKSSCAGLTRASIRQMSLQRVIAGRARSARPGNRSCENGWMP